MRREPIFIPSERCILFPTKDGELTCIDCDSDFDGVSWFKPINENAKPKEKSQLMLMTDRKPLELWDWGLNEKVTIPTENSGCREISDFIRFIESRKF